MTYNQLIKDAMTLIVDLLPSNPLVAELLARHHRAAMEEFGERGGTVLLCSLVSLYRLLDAEQKIRDATALKSLLPRVIGSDVVCDDLSATLEIMQTEQPLFAASLANTANLCTLEEVAKMSGGTQELAFRIGVSAYDILRRAAERELLESNTREPV